MTHTFTVSVLPLHHSAHCCLTQASNTDRPTDRPTCYTECFLPCGTTVEVPLNNHTAAPFHVLSNSLYITIILSSNNKYPRSGQHIGCTYFQSPLNYVCKPTELRSCLFLYTEVKLVFNIKGTTEFGGTGEEVQRKKISVPTRLEEDEGSCIMRTFMICTTQNVL